MYVEKRLKDLQKFLDKVTSVKEFWSREVFIFLGIPEDYHEELLNSKTEDDFSLSQGT